MAEPSAAGTVAAGPATSSCDFALQLGSESGRRLLVNGVGDGEPAETGGVLIWAPLPTTGKATAMAIPVASAPEPGITSGHMAGALEFLERARGPLRTLRVLQSGAAAPCCGSRSLVELGTDELLLRAPLHEPAARSGEEFGRLRAEYSPREASDWAVCEWNSHLLDPLEAAGVLLVDAQLAAGQGPLAYVLWQDVDGVPRAWETFADLPEPGLLQAALADHFRYAARDAELLVIDRSPTRPVGRGAPLAEELVDTAPFARPPLPQAEG